MLAHESFENESTAKIMNDHFVNIKVDREERPDVDRMYMTYLQVSPLLDPAGVNLRRDFEATQGGGGWPMSVCGCPALLLDHSDHLRAVLTPNLEPFFAGKEVLTK